MWKPYGIRCGHKSLAMLKCESRTSLHLVQYKWQSGSVLLLYSYYFKSG